MNKVSGKKNPKKTKPTKKKNKGGRPTKMTEMTLKKLEEAFSIGASVREACAYADITPQTLYNYEEKCPKFFERRELLTQKPVLAAKFALLTAIKGSPAAGIRPDGKLALQYLERKNRDEFGPHIKQEVTHIEAAANFHMERTKKLDEKVKDIDLELEQLKEGFETDENVS